MSNSAKTERNINLENLTVITGGARSGKSLFAEELARAWKGPVSYIATMPRIEGDDELAFKVEHHILRRPRQWQTIEAQLSIHERFKDLPGGKGLCIIDCLSLYVSNIMLDRLKTAQDVVSPQTLKELDIDVSEAISALMSAIQEHSATDFIIVTNEVGWSVVPENKPARLYKDLLGNANQTVARAAANVYLTCVGLPLKLKENGRPRLNS